MKNRPPIDLVLNLTMNLSQQLLEAHRDTEELSALRIKWLRKAASEATDFSELYCLYELSLSLVEKYPNKQHTLKSISHSIKLKLAENQSD